MGKKKRRSAAVKEGVVLRWLKGEDLELVSRDTGFGLHELTAWRAMNLNRQLPDRLQARCMLLFIRRNGDELCRGATYRGIAG